MCQKHVVNRQKRKQISVGVQHQSYFSHLHCNNAALQFQRCVGPPVTLQFYSIGSVHEHNSPLTRRLIWQWLWRWPLWRSAVWSQPQSNCPEWNTKLQIDSHSNCSPHGVSVCSFVQKSKRDLKQILWFQNINGGQSRKYHIFIGTLKIFAVQNYLAFLSMERLIQT